MKKVSVMLAVLMALTMLPAAGVSALDGNLLQNAGFETEGNEDYPLAAHWKIYEGENASVTSNDTSDGKYLQFDAKDNIVTQRVAVSAEKEYVISLRVLRGGLIGGVRVIARDADQVVINSGTPIFQSGELKQGSDYLIGGTGGNDGTWSKYEMIIYGKDFPENTAFLDIGVEAVKGTAGNTVGFDDVYFGEVSSDVVYTNDEGAALDSIAAGPVNVTYNAYLPSTVTTETKIVAIAAVFKVEGSVKMLDDIKVLDATTLTAGAKTPIVFAEPFTVKDDGEYMIKVFSLNALASLTPFETLPALEKAVTAEPEA